MAVSCNTWLLPPGGSSSPSLLLVWPCLFPSNSFLSHLAEPRQLANMVKDIHFFLPGFSDGFLHYFCAHPF